MKLEFIEKEDEENLLKLNPFNDLKEEVSEEEPVILVKSLRCDFCKEETQGEIKDQELLCRNCGMVLDQNPEYIDVDPKDSESLKHETETSDSLYSNVSGSNEDYKADEEEDEKNVNYKIGLPTMIHSRFKTKSQKRENNLRGASLRVVRTSTNQRNKFKGHLEINRLSKVLNLPEFVENKAIAYFRRFSDMSLLRNRSIPGCVTALLVILCNYYNIPISIGEALKESSIAFKNRRKKFNKEYFYLYYLLQTAYPASACAQTFLDKYCSYISDWPKKKAFKESLYNICDEIGFIFMEGRDSIVTAACLAYFLLIYYEHPDINSLCGKIFLNKQTLKNKFYNLIQEFPELALECYLKKDDLEAFILEKSKNSKATSNNRYEQKIKNLNKNEDYRIPKDYKTVEKVKKPLKTLSKETEDLTEEEISAKKNLTDLFAIQEKT